MIEYQIRDKSGKVVSTSNNAETAFKKLDALNKKERSHSIKRVMKKEK